MAVIERVTDLFLLILILFSCRLALGAVSCRRIPLIFNFGDSNSDTGGLIAGLGLPVGPPNGRLFFRRATGRFCDGRLAIDFLCKISSSPCRRSSSEANDSLGGSYYYY